MIAVALLFFVGTRLLAPTRESAQPATVDAKSGGANERSIAVLPFINLSGDPAQAYFADGITEDLITDLARLPGLMVIARNSSFAYKGKQVRPQQIAQELGIRYLLEGSVQRQGDRLRINAQLIDALGGQHLWADRYSGTMDDVFALQDKVIGEIVAALQLELPDTTGRSETSNPAAYDALLQGLERLRQGNEAETSAAIKAFERAVALDPDYARAHAWLAHTHGQIVHRSGTWPPAPVSERPTTACRSILPSPCARPHRWRMPSTPNRRFARAATAKQWPRSTTHWPSRRAIPTFTSRARKFSMPSVGAARRRPRCDARCVSSRAFHRPTRVCWRWRSSDQQKYEEALATITEVVNRQSDDPFDFATMIACLWATRAHGRRQGSNRESTTRSRFLPSWIR